MQQFSIKATTFALTSVAVIAYGLCVIFKPIFPEWPMYQSMLWQAFFPGFSWSLVGVLIGLLWTVAYAAFGAALFAGAYNIFLARNQVDAESFHSTNQPHGSV